MTGKIEVDVHSHTLASGHAYGTADEMFRAASKKGLKLYGITEHTSGIPGTCTDIYFLNIKVVPRRQYGMEVMLGAEINIRDYKGTLDLDQKYFKFLDVRLAGIHTICYKPGNVSENTEAYLGAIRNPGVDIIVHPDNDKVPADVETLCYAAKENHTLLEINNNSLRLPDRKGVRNNILKILECCKKINQPVIIGSDAHYMCDIANYDHAEKLIEEAEFPKELILNYSAEKFKAYLASNHEPGINNDDSHFM